MNELEDADKYIDEAINLAEDIIWIYWAQKAGINNKMKNYDIVLDCFNEISNSGEMCDAQQIMQKYYSILGNPVEMLKYENMYRAYIALASNDTKKKLEEEISMLKTAKSRGQYHVDYTFPYIFNCVSGAGLEGFNIYECRNEINLDTAKEILMNDNSLWGQLEAQGRRIITTGCYATFVMELDSQPEENLFLFHVYDFIELPVGEHIATYGWYEVNIDTNEVKYLR